MYCNPTSTGKHEFQLQFLRKERINTGQVIEIVDIFVIYQLFDLTDQIN